MNTLLARYAKHDGRRTAVVTATMLTPQSINEFKQLYAEEYGVELSDAEVVVRTTALIRLLDHVYDPPDQPR